jgi:hypothetical protein
MKKSTQMQFRAHPKLKERIKSAVRRYGKTHKGLTATSLFERGIELALEELATGAKTK